MPFTSIVCILDIHTYVRNLYDSILIYLLRTYSILKFFLGIIEQTEMHQRTESMWQYGRSYGEGEITDAVWQARLYSLHRSKDGISLALSRSCAACCRWPWFGRGVGLDDPQRSLPTPNILWFCDSVTASSAQSESAQSILLLLTLEEIESHCIFWSFLHISWGIIWHCAHSSYNTMTYLMHSRSWSWMPKGWE